MRWISLLVLTLWLLVAGASGAHAGPIGVALAGIGSFLASGTILAQLALSAIFTAVKIGISLLTKAKETNKEAGVSSDVTFGGKTSESFLIGRFATPGHLEYMNTYGNVDKTPNAYLTTVLSMGDLPMAGTGLWVDDKKIVLPDMSGAAPDEKGWPLSEFNVDGKDHLWVRFYDGSQTATPPFLLSKFGTDPNRPITADMIWRGVPLLIATARVNSEVFNSFPEYIIESSGIKLYDPRKDTTVGGSGAHRWGNQATYEPSNNNIVQAYNILRGIFYGTEHFWGGRCEAWQLPVANWMAAMNACDLAITLTGGGTEPQFQSGGEVFVEEEPLSVVEALIKGASGTFANLGGYYKVYVGAPAAPVYSFTDAALIVTEGRTLDPFPGLDQVYNGAQASYPEPLERWAAKDAPAYLRTDLEVVDDGRQLVTGLQYPYTPYAVQVQRLLKAAVEDSRRFLTHSIVLPPEAEIVEAGDVIAWSSDWNQYTNKKFLVVDKDTDSNFLQYLMIREVDPADHSWTPLTDQKAYSIGFIGSVIPVPQPTVGITVEAYILYDAEARARRPTILVRYPGDLDDVGDVIVTVRLADDETGVSVTRKPYGAVGAPASQKIMVLSAGPYLPDEDYEVQVLLVPKSTRKATPTAWLAVHTDNVQLIGDDISNGAISITKFADGITPVEILPATPSAGDPGNFVGRQVYNTTDGLLYTFNGTTWEPIEADVLDGSITSAKLADAAVTADKLATAAVTELKIAADAVTAVKIATGAVLEAKLAANAVTVSKIADGAVIAAKIADAAISLSKFASGIRPVETVATLPVTGNVEGRLVYLTTDDKLYRWTGSAWTAEVAASNITGQLTDAQIAAVAAAKVTGQITGTQITDGAITTAKIFAGAVTTASLAAGAVVADKIGANAVTAAAINAGAVTTAKLAAGAVTANELAANSVIAGKIAAAAVSTNELAANAVVSAKIAADAITARELILSDYNCLNQSPNFDPPAGWLPSTNPAVCGVAPTTAGYGSPYAAWGFAAGLAQITNGNDRISISAGDQLSIVAWGRNISINNGIVYCGVNFYDKTDTYLFQGTVTYNQTDSFSFVKKTLITTAPANTAYAKPFILFNTTDMGVGGTLLIGYFGIFKAANADLIVDGSITAGKIAANAVTAGKIAANAITAGTIAAGAITATEIASGAVTTAKIAAGAVVAASIAAGTITGDKLVASSITARELILTDYNSLTQSPNFDPPAGWGSSSNPAVAIVGGTTVGISNFAAYIYAPGSASIINGNSKIEVVGADQFTIISWARNFDVTSGWALCAVYFLDKNGLQLGVDYTFHDNTQLPSAGYVKLTKTVTAPGGTVFIRPQINFNVMSGSTYVVGYFGVFKAANADLIVDGAITAAKIAANSISAGMLQANSVTAGKVAAGAIGATQISVTNLSAINSNIGTITAGIIQSADAKMIIHLTNSNIIMSD